MNDINLLQMNLDKAYIKHEIIYYIEELDKEIEYIVIDIIELE